MPTAMELMDRHKALIECLPFTGEGLGKTELAVWVSANKVDYRTVQRNLDTLAHAGLVRFEPVGRSYRRFRGVHRAAWYEISREQAFVLQVVDHKVRALQPSALATVLEPHVQQAAEILGIPEYGAEQACFQKVVALPSLLLPRIVPDTWGRPSNFKLASFDAVLTIGPHESTSILL